MGKVAVTGGAGFIGSNLVRKLLDQGREVIIIDDFSSGFKENLSDLDINQNCEVGDLRNYDFAVKALRDVDVVYHMAADVGSVQHLHGSESNELHALQANLVIDANVFKSCIENNIRTIVYASSVSVYPADEQLSLGAVFAEEDSERKVNPEGGYGWSKYVAEKQLAFMKDFHVGVARIFHAYGTNLYMKPDKSQVIASLIRKAIMYPAEPFIVWGDGTQRRCFVYIDDVIDAFFKLEHYVEKHGKLTVNVGSSEEISIGQLAQLVVNLSKKNVSPKYDTSKPTGVKSRIPDLKRIRSILGWSQTTSLSVGLLKTYEWAEKRLS